ncbi:hypothetical protein [Demequina aurantiaca]|uniref:hypothetical protein n=1 Tax=Demequina aurantiaca TaxID=676200 RepID=UPI000783CAFF|nr:hypothetical protein [Demequina aurantiaca]
MDIAMDAADMDAVRKRLTDASNALVDAVPTMLGNAPYGSAELGAAASAFELALGREARSLGKQWTDLAAGVQGTVADMEAQESESVGKLDALRGRLS